MRYHSILHYERSVEAMNARATGVRTDAADDATRLVERAAAILRENDRAHGGTDCPGCGEWLWGYSIGQHAEDCRPLLAFASENP